MEKGEGGPTDPVDALCFVSLEELGKLAPEDGWRREQRRSGWDGLHPCVISKGPPQGGRLVCTRRRRDPKVSSRTRRQAGWEGTEPQRAGGR